MRNFLGLFCLFFVLAISMSCGDTDPSEDIDGYMNEGAKSNIDEIKNVFYMIPSPMETVIIFKKAGLVYHNDLLNNPSNADKYDTKIKKAINLGVYGADLSYATLNEQNQETMFFVSAAKKLAESLGVMKAFDEETIARIEDNIENKDSMIHIVSDVYWIADSYLKENESVGTSAVIIFGGWLESVYIAAGALKKDFNNQTLQERLLDQKHTIKNLTLLLSSIEDQELKEVTSELKKIQVVFDQCATNEQPITVNLDQPVGVISGSQKTSATKAQLEELIKLIQSVRAKYCSV